MVARPPIIPPVIPPARRHASEDEHVVSRAAGHDTINNDVTAVKNTTKQFVLGKAVYIERNDIVLKLVRFLFQYSNEDYVLVQIRHNGRVIVPSTAPLNSKYMKQNKIKMTGYIKSTDLPVVVYVYQELRNSDRLEIWYKNTDIAYDHDFQVFYELETKVRGRVK